MDTDATIGEGTIVEPGVVVGFRYHRQAGPTRVGAHGIQRIGTIVYGDVTIGDHFQSGRHIVIRAKVRMGDHCTVLHRGGDAGHQGCAGGSYVIGHPGRISPLPAHLDRPTIGG